MEFFENSWLSDIRLSLYTDRPIAESASISAFQLARTGQSNQMRGIIRALNFGEANFKLNKHLGG